MLSCLSKGDSNFIKEFQLLFSIVNLLLFDLAVDHSVKGIHVLLVISRSLLIDLESSLKVTQHCSLVTKLSGEKRILRL